MKKVLARREAERLFLRLCNKHLRQKEGVIHVNYARRFPPGKCIIGITIPIRNEPLGRIIALGMEHVQCQYPPAIINSGNGLCLRLIHCITDIQSSESARLLEHARMLARRAEQDFEMTAIVLPLGGLVGTLWSLRALQPSEQTQKI
jgi:hypothetical protein